MFFFGISWKIYPASWATFSQIPEIGMKRSDIDVGNKLFQMLVAASGSMGCRGANLK